MASESNLRLVSTEDSPELPISQPESATAKENKKLRLRMLEMWDAWSNSREPPNTIHGFPELVPRTVGTTNIPMTNPFVPFGYPSISSFIGIPYVVRPQTPFSKAPSMLFSAAPVFTMAQPTVPRPCFELSTFTFQWSQTGQTPSPPHTKLMLDVNTTLE
nr:uncharacterized protein LOC117280213 [Nicotiana tomentosiformis]